MHKSKPLRNSFYKKQLKEKKKIEHAIDKEIRGFCSQNKNYKDTSQNSLSNFKMIVLFIRYSEKNKYEFLFIDIILTVHLQIKGLIIQLKIFESYLENE